MSAKHTSELIEEFKYKLKLRKSELVQQAEKLDENDEKESILLEFTINEFARVNKILKLIDKNKL